MHRRLLSHLRANAVAYLALFVALSGTALAAKTVYLARGDAAGGDLAGTYPSPTIKAGAINGGAEGDIADNTVTGADVDESTLGEVPNAKTSTAIDGKSVQDIRSGIDADKLDGKDSTEFVEADQGCSPGDFVTGIDASGAIVCTTPGAGGDGGGGGDGGPADCDDGNAATIDTYDPIDGCIHTPINCDDGDPNTVDFADPATGACIHQQLFLP